MTRSFRSTRRAFAAMVWCLATLAPASAQERATAPSSAPPPVRIEAVTARNGMVVAQEKRASRIGVEILEKGG
ncbi:MAG TPA: gamma-glutamyltransferase, partial [Xanthobacteraceae bacterium]|nr:gamma-glutamyltransferase [Xanthobacteraceae bacterium]